ncbi:hypothetical protein PROFUN_06703 [Planoprotostelium fungivorum]|uniref:Uncharacterized protein n=1 Tax=Planoprotostelium fungivorum TaxID=1890364 RepID=A0A2P6NG38_9EUKA|nr:hypothetical protein PROFUN_06703 [Planoprotostelium fungivorum]
MGSPLSSFVLVFADTNRRNSKNPPFVTLSLQLSHIYVFKPLDQGTTNTSTTSISTSISHRPRSIAVLNGKNKRPELPAAGACTERASYSYLSYHTTNNPCTDNNIHTIMKVLLLTMGLAFCLVSAGSFKAEGPEGAVSYKSDEVSRILAIASILKGAQNDADDRGLLSDINIIGNFIGGKKNRIDAINDFGGDFSGYGQKKRSFDDIFGRTGTDFSDFSLVDIVYGLVTPHTYRQSSPFDNLKRYAVATQDFSLLRDLNVIGNFIGGKENRIDAINGYKGIGSGAF